MARRTACNPDLDITNTEKRREEKKGGETKNRKDANQHYTSHGDGGVVVHGGLRYAGEMVPNDVEVAGPVDGHLAEQVKGHRVVVVPVFVFVRGGGRKKEKDRRRE